MEARIQRARGPGGLTPCHSPRGSWILWSIEAPSRFVVGIDLGTTNSAMAYVDTQETPRRVRVFPLPQLVGPAQVESLETLPSFHYHAAAGETESGVLRLPWSRRNADYAVGVFARDEGTKTPGRIIASAKSWLSHSGVDRTAELLPWQGATDVERLSPVEVERPLLAAHARCLERALPR